MGFRFMIFQRDNFTCVYCGRSPKEDGIKLEVDHYNPRKNGGKDKIFNYVTACFDCNRGKAANLITKTTPD